MTNTLQLDWARNLGWRLNLPRQKNSERSENQKTGRASMEVAKAPSDRGMPKLARCSAGQSRSTKNSSRSKQQRNDCNELYLFLTRILKDIKHNFTLYYSNSKTSILSAQINATQPKGSCSPSAGRSNARPRRYYLKDEESMKYFEESPE